MPLRFREDRTTQAVARLLKLHKRPMDVMKLIKLIYLVDRKALVSWGRPITFDWYFSLPHGPVLSFTLDKINEDLADGEDPSYWHQFISERKGNKVSLLAPDLPNDKLSPADEDLIDEVFQKYGWMTASQLRKFCHEKCPEWKDPQGSRLPIEIEDILRAEGFSDPEISDVLDALGGETVADRLLR